MLFSIVALYNYDSKILNGIEPYLPLRPTNREISIDFRPIDFEILKNTILLRAGELSLVYSEPDLFKLSLAMWAAKNRLKWQNLYDTVYYDYDPLFSKIRQYTLDRKTHDTSDSENTTTETVGEIAKTKIYNIGNFSVPASKKEEKLLTLKQNCGIMSNRTGKNYPSLCRQKS